MCNPWTFISPALLGVVRRKVTRIGNIGLTLLIWRPLMIKLLLYEQLYQNLLLKFWMNNGLPCVGKETPNFRHYSGSVTYLSATLIDEWLCVIPTGLYRWAFTSASPRCSIEPDTGVRTSASLKLSLLVCLFFFPSGVQFHCFPLYIVVCSICFCHVLFDSSVLWYSAS